MAGQVIRIERDELALIFDPGAGTAQVARRDEAIGFGPLAAWARLRPPGDRMHVPVSSLTPGWAVEEAEIETPVGAGPGLRATLADAPGLPARLIWELALVGGEGLAARMSILNDPGCKPVLLGRKPVPLRVFEMSPLAYRGADPGLEMGAGFTAWRFYRTGYQSWSPAGSVGVMAPDVKPRFGLAGRSTVSARTPYSRKPGEKAADWMAQLVEPKLGLGALLGFITSDRLAGRVEFEVRYDRFRRLEAVADGEGMSLAPGEGLASEWALLSLSRDPLGQQARYLDAWGRAMQARPSRPRSGWCSWYFAFTDVTENTVSTNLARLEREFKGQLDLVQLDDGFEPAPGEWTAWNEKFPSPPAELSRRIRERGFEPGLWLAPFLVSRASILYRMHPQWVVRNESGRPVIAFIHSSWQGKVMYALDLTHPAVQTWLRETITTIVSEYGFKYLKLDFLYAAALPGARYDRAVTGIGALRRGLEIIRAAAGPETYLVGCGCPLGPAVGLVDAMRVSPDVDVRWRRPVLDAAMGVPSGPSAINCLRGGLARMLMHGRLWANDPDCVVLRNEKGMTAPERRSLLTMIYLSGGQAFLSEDLATLPADRLDWFRRLLPPSNEAGVPMDLFASDLPETVLLRHEASALVARFNFSDFPREATLDLARLGLDGPWHVFDGWAELPLGVVTGRLGLGFIPPHGVKYLRLVRADGQARLLGTNLHLGLGEHYVTAVKDGDGLKVGIKLPGKRKGKVWGVFAGGGVAVKEIEFVDGWEGELG
jgi:alpha-galactosidase